MSLGRPASVLVLLAACSGGGPAGAIDAPTDDFDRRALLTHLGTNLLLPMQAEFEVAAAALPSAITTYCEALEAGDPGATLAAARTAWGEALDAWQRAEALLIGPAAMDDKALRDRIYGWPLLSTCGVDRDTATRWAEPASHDVSTTLVNVRSLAAIEYLLHTSGTAHNCASTPVGWDAMGAALPRARCRLAAAIAADVAVQAAALHTAWRPEGGDYVGELARAGQAGSTIASAHDGVNIVSDGLFYVDKMVKDMKLAEAAGIAINACGTVGTPCDREVELRYADRATFAIRENLATLRRAFTGRTPAGDGPGFETFLRAVGNDELAARMVTKLDAAIAQAAALPDSFLTALASDYDQVVATHAALTAFTDDLKSQFLTVLALEIPDDVAADND